MGTPAPHLWGPGIAQTALTNPSFSPDSPGTAHPQAESLRLPHPSLSDPAAKAPPPQPPDSPPAVPAWLSPEWGPSMAFARGPRRGRSAPASHSSSFQSRPADPRSPDSPSEPPAQNAELY